MFICNTNHTLGCTYHLHWCCLLLHKRFETPVYCHLHLRKNSDVQCCSGSWATGKHNSHSRHVVLCLPYLSHHSTRDDHCCSLHHGRHWSQAPWRQLPAKKAYFKVVTLRLWIILTKALKARYSWYHLTVQHSHLSPIRYAYGCGVRCFIVMISWVLATSIGNILPCTPGLFY